MIEGDMRIFCSPFMDLIPVYFTVDEERLLLPKNKPCRKVVEVFNPG
jgi:hypothetical protein